MDKGLIAELEKLGAKCNFIKNKKEGSLFVKYRGETIYIVKFIACQSEYFGMINLTDEDCSFDKLDEVLTTKEAALAKIKVVIDKKEQEPRVSLREVIRRIDKSESHSVNMEDLCREFDIVYNYESENEKLWSDRVKRVLCIKMVLHGYLGWHDRNFYE